MPELIATFEELGRDDIARVGGKGANLGELTRIGVRVPPGFCVTTTAFDEFVTSVTELDHLLDEVDSLDPDDVESVRRCGARVRETIEAVPVSARLRDALFETFNRIDDDDAWAVRSSATLEDLPEASFAGQQDTYLNVRGTDDLLDAVRRCWASLFTDRAILYRRRNGFGSRVAKLSVVVQRMVRSDVSGILFTADPITGHRRICSIDASYGLGEAVVSGVVDADNFRLDRRTGDERSRRLGAKSVEIVGLHEGGTDRRDVEDARASSPCLTEAQLAQLVGLADTIESHYGGTPQDIEWAYEDGVLHVLQSRPITTLFPVPVSTNKDNGLHVFISFGHVQVMTEPMRQLGMDVIRLVLPVGKPGDDPAELNPYIVEAGHRLWADLTPALRARPLRDRVPSVLDFVDETMSAIVREIVSRDEFSARGGSAARLHGFARRFALPMFLRTVANVLWRRHQSVRDNAVAVLEKLEAESRTMLESPNDRIATIRRVVGRCLLYLFPLVMPVVLAGVISMRLLERRFGKERVDPLSRGLVGNVTTDMDLELADVADAAREVPELCELLRSEPDADGFEAGRDIDGSGQFYALWDAFLARYGHRGPGEIDISRPRWQDDPRSLSKTLTGMMVDPSLGAHRQKHDALATAGDAAGEALVEDAGFGRRWWVRRLVRNVRTYLALREHPKFYLMRIFGEVRRELLAIAAELVQRDVLREREDVWVLRIDEVDAALRGELDDVPKLVERRNAERTRFFDLRPPRVITSDGESPPPPRRSDLPPGALAGISASTGVVEGRARVVMDPTGEVLHAGEILVAPFSDPGWTPLFIHAAGLVMEVGGLMTHGSVVAREYGIPAVVGVDDATRTIETGQRIRVDGDTGIVELLDDDPAVEAA